MDKIEDVWGIGKRLAIRLKSLGIHTAYDFTLLPEDFVKSHFSIIVLRLQKELKGISVLDLEEVRDKKSIATTRSFRHEISDFEALKERISIFATSCAEKLRKQKLCCNLLAIYINTNRFSGSEQYKKVIHIPLPYASNSDFTLSKCAFEGLERIFNSNYSYKKAGVIALELLPQSSVQMNLFENENPKYIPLMKVMDTINKKAAKKLVKLASQSIEKGDIMRKEFMSNRYTTNWEEILEVR